MADEDDGMEENKQWLAAAFGRAAPTFDRVGPRFFGFFGRWLVQQAGLRAGEHVLDVACGRGSALLPASEAVGEQGLVVGIDLSEGMIKALAAEVRDQQRTNVGVCVMDAERLEFPDESFDCVLCGFSLYFFPRLEQALAEMRRVLRPDGRIAVTTWHKAGDSDWEWYRDLVKAYLPPQEEAAAPEGPGPVFDEPQGVEAILQAAGFQDLHSSTEMFDAIYRDEEEWWDTAWSHGWRMNLEAIEAQGADALESFKTEAFRGLQRVRAADGFHSNWKAICAVGRK